MLLTLQSKKPVDVPETDVITSIVYGVRDISAALYKSLSGFATAGTNIIKLESFVPMTKHSSAHFYLEFEGNPDMEPHNTAIEELKHCTKGLEILGTYKKSPYRADSLA